MNKTLKTILCIVLALCAIFLVYEIYDGIMEPVRFNKEVEQRQKVAVQRLKDIRDLQVAFKGANERERRKIMQNFFQGEQVAAIWKPLKELFGIHIDFAYRTFRWDSEASLKAHVHCVIIGFSVAPCDKPKLLFDNGQVTEAKNINGYLMQADDIFIESRKSPLCKVPKMVTGNRPADGGHLIIEADEYEGFIKKEPNALPYIKKLVGADEYINGKLRWCLWLEGVSPTIIKSMPLVLERVKLCKEARLNGASDRQKLACTPTLFRETLNPDTSIIIPVVSSQNRIYVPMGHRCNSVR